MPAGNRWALCFFCYAGGEPLGTLFFCYTSGGTAGHSVFLLCRRRTAGHSFFLLCRRENRWALCFLLCRRRTAGHLLSYCQLLLDAATIGTDHVDATDTDVGVDGFAWLYGEGGYGETTHVDDAYVSLTAQRRGDADGMLTDSDDEVTFSEVIARRVFIVTEGERRVGRAPEPSAMKYGRNGTVMAPPVGVTSKLLPSAFIR